MGANLRIHLVASSARPRGLQVNIAAQVVPAAEQGVEVIGFRGGESGGVRTMGLPQVVDAASLIPVVGYFSTPSKGKTR